MISFLLFGLVAAVFAGLYGINRWIKDDSSAISLSNWLLTAASYLFAAYADYRFALILGALTVSTWYFGKKGKQGWGITLALVCLGLFKYTNFFGESFARLIGRDYTALKLILPIGISFYTFSAISYLADLSRGKCAPAGIGEVALYLSFFPKLTSGPIQKSGAFFGQMRSRRAVGWNTFSAGVQIFAFGMFKKMVLADRLSIFVDQVFSVPNAFGSLTVFLAVVAYSFQIYFDFSGYSDMAIGVAGILGFSLPRNFNLPYLSHNVTEFWKRWHITLSSWLQEYLYISLGGNRKGKLRTYVNLILTMVLGGIWHGASWTYVIWGLLHGLALALHKVWMSVTGSKEKEHSGAANAVSIGITFLFVSFCWIFFRAESLEQALTVVKRIFAFQTGVESVYLWLVISLILFTVSCAEACMKSAPANGKARVKNVSTVEGFYPILNLEKFGNLVLFFVFCGLILCLAYTGGSPFIYGNY